MSSKNPLGVGIIGAGIMGHHHAGAFACDPRAQLRGVASLPLAGARELAERHGAPFFTDDYRKLLQRPDIDLVTIATPDHLHREICVAAAQAGKHFMVEKPLSTNLADGDAIIAAVKTSGVKAMVCFNHRWIMSYARARQAIEEGRIGRPVLAYARKNDRIYVPTKMLSWAAETTPAWFLSSHDIDLVLWFMEARAVEVYATAVWGVLRGRGIDTPDAVQAQVRFDGGRVATFEACWIYPDTYPSMTDSFIEVIGEKGVIHLPRDHEQIVMSTNEAHEFPRTAIHTMVHGVQRGSVSDSIHHMIGCVIDGKEPVVTMESSRHVTAILDAIHRSIASGRPETVDG